MSFADAVAAYELREVPLDLAVVPDGGLVVVGGEHALERLPALGVPRLRLAAAEPAVVASRP